jgi:AraC-like DNA-binding protein
MTPAAGNDASPPSAFPQMLRLSHHDVPARERMSYLHDFVARGVAGLHFTPRIDGFEFKVAIRRLEGDVAVGRARYSAVRGERTRELAGDGRSNYMLTIHDTDYEVEAEGGRRLQVSRGDIVIVNEGLRQSFTLPGTGLTAIVLDERMMAGVAPAIRSRPLHHIPAARPCAALIAGYAGLLLDDASLDGAASRLAVRHLHDLAALALEPSGRHLPEPSGIGGARLALVKQEMVRNLTDPELDIAAVARRQCVTPRYIQRLFEREGATFGKFLRDARLELARAGLETGDARSIATLAFDCGFGDLSHFNKAFRRRFGMTPSDVRAAALLQAVSPIRD